MKVRVSEQRLGYVWGLACQVSDRNLSGSDRLDSPLWTMFYALDDRVLEEPAGCELAISGSDPNGIPSLEVVRR